MLNNNGPIRKSVPMVSYLPHMPHVANQYEIKDITYISNHIRLSPKIYKRSSQHPANRLE